MSSFYEFDAADTFTSGALGQPGQRTFVLQVRADGVSVTMKCEKQQVAALSQYIRQLLADAPDVKDRPIEDAMQLAPSPEIEFVVGTVGIAYDSRNDRMVVQIEEFIPTDDNEEPPAHSWLVFSCTSLSPFQRRCCSHHSWIAKSIG